MNLNRLVLTISFICLTAMEILAHPANTEANDRVVTFHFVAGRDMFYAAFESNNNQLERLYGLVEEFRAEILSGTMPVYVDGYCASLPSRKANLNKAFIRANRVKSELILHAGLREEHFITKNYAEDYRGQKDMVVVTLRIPEKISSEPRQPDPDPVVEPEPGPVVESQPEPIVREEPLVSQRDIYAFAVRTNLLYDAFLTPTLGVEWRVNRHMGIKLDGSYAHWGNNHGKVQKLWLISPEVRWYMGNTKRLYVGASANIGEYNLYKYMLGSLFSGDTGYQGNLYGGGVTVGYQFALCNHLSLDLNLGLGYTRFEYDTFFLSNDVRVYKEHNVVKNFWGPTQAGISLVWTVGGNK